ncbi:uncharacterized protein DFL_003672 [Arthrobotrys flagrans]|uniref:Transcription factor Iwr1 domain-containing protein n=1 Tax=Arthrobotrys flagrans TaxID=97331 RepID=A0A437A2I0_ARTFL|nr:hypothetical protein DFL_003672 [Arthrobotrys flagrans]
MSPSSPLFADAAESQQGPSSDSGPDAYFKFYTDNPDDEDEDSLDDYTSCGEGEGNEYPAYGRYKGEEEYANYGVDDDMDDDEG